MNPPISATNSIQSSKDELPIGKIINFIRSYNVTETMEGSYINNATQSTTLNAIKERLGLAKITNMFLTKKDIYNILNTTLDI